MSIIRSPLGVNFFVLKSVTPNMPRTEDHEGGPTISFLREKLNGAAGESSWMQARV
jgi:hypothetical protein